MSRGAFLAFALVFAWFGRDGTRAHAQTKVRPDQVRSWQQVAPPGSKPGRGLLTLEQLGIDPAIVAQWKELIAAKSYDHYRVAIGNDQPAPVLILCSRPEDSPAGPGCVGGQFWFTAK